MKQSNVTTQLKNLFFSKPTMIAEFAVSDVSTLLSSVSTIDVNMVTPASTPVRKINNKAIISIDGVLIHKLTWQGWGMTGYDFIRSQLHAAMDDGGVGEIVLDIHSPGGTSMGLFDLAHEIKQISAIKNVTAIVDGYCCSAAYALASSCNKIYATEDSQIGSVGSVIMHMSQEKYLNDVGLEITLITHGSHKMDGNPYKNLSDSSLKTLQDANTRAGDKFVNLVATNRGLSVETVANMEARVYDGSTAVALGLIDGIKSNADLRSYVHNLTNEVMTMNTEIPATTAQATTAPATTAPVATAPVTTAPATTAPATTAPATTAPATTAPATTAPATTAPEMSEKERIGAILQSEHATNLHNLATTIALSTSLSVSEAEMILQAAAAELANSGTRSTAFTQAMGDDNPGISAGNEAPTTQSENNESVAMLKAAIARKTKG